MATISPPAVPTTEEASKKRRRVAVPTSIVVTLLGAALTVWLAPALTRQWEDRQRARDLKAVLAGEMVTSAARAIQAGAPISDGHGKWETVFGRWLEEGALEVEVRQKAYFAMPIVTRWKDVVQDVKYFLIVSDNVAIIRRDTRPGQLLAFGGLSYRRQRIREELKILAPTRGEANKAARQLASDAPLDRVLGMHIVRSWMLDKVVAAADEVLSAHPRGFSTTRRDLVRDLLP
jgi:hypothetical protein